MLLTLAVSSLRTILHRGSPGGERSLDPLDVPRFAREELGLHGLNIPAWLLSGWNAAHLERLRDVADKAACPCLILVDDEALELGAMPGNSRQAATDRFAQLTSAASRLGCSSLAIGCKGPTSGSDACFTRTVDTLKATFGTIDRLELNVLVRPAGGMLEDPVRLTDLIKQIGGFRIGSLPDFGHAFRSKDPAMTLRKLAPYAGAIHATVEGFDADGRHLGCDLPACVQAIRSVGYQNTLAIEFVGKSGAVSSVLKARDILLEAIEGDEGKAAPDLEKTPARRTATPLDEGPEDAEEGKDEP